ncbi:HIT domain-containing protein [Marinobacter caseinilyticus]|uniref:HIT domain-containing protein n=1 Tax=Marinobacter caseinilyticus TaxID=2692195 RepID=UPI00140C79F1|nr:HIT domain-containing protein [Marinobacter caseinilyticus]
MSFQLHERLAADTISLGRTELCELRLMNDSSWPWVLLVPRRPDIREIYELSEADQIQLLKESSALGQGMMAVFAGDKLNVAALGNMVPQLHLHHIVRFEGDSAWPGPVWGKQAAMPYTDDMLQRQFERFEPILAAVRNC